MKILLLGHNGQVGRELQRTLLPLGELVALGRAEANLEDPASIKAILEHHAPGIVVNAAAYTAVDKAESDEEAARQVNAAAVGAMAAYARHAQALLVHYSTDYVFDGEKTGAYNEDDAPNPQSVYGRTKRLGEEAILASGCAALVFRTSWVFSAHGSNFIKTVIRLARERDNIGIVADQVGAPTSAELIADITALAIAAHQKQCLASGIYHLTAAGATSWHGLARHVVQTLAAKSVPLKLNAQDIRAISTEEYPLPAKRPKNSRLDTGKLSTALGLHIPPWTVHVDRMLDQLLPLRTTE